MKCAKSMRVWQWPEFRAFAERLGIDLSAPHTSLTIHMPIGNEGDGLVKVSQETFGRDQSIAEVDGT